MRPDVIDLREFYNARLGQVARHLVRYRIRRLWPNLHGMEVLGLGYATPYLQQFRDEAARVIALMPAAQGVHRWPSDGPGLVALADDTELPLADASVDRILLVHGLENAEQVRRLLREAWRVLASGGRLLAVVPNRSGIWARAEGTPFGHGYPYSQGQLYRLFRDNMFQPTQHAGALYVPPLRSRMLLRTAPAWEKLGQSWARAVAGVLLVEAEKQIYAGTAVRARRQRRPIAVGLPSRPNAAARKHRIVAD
jgi:SAM-dependent methyltransferase